MAASSLMSSKQDLADSKESWMRPVVWGIGLLAVVTIDTANEAPKGKVSERQLRPGQPQ